MNREKAIAESIELIDKAYALLAPHGMGELLKRTGLCAPLDPKERYAVKDARVVTELLNALHTANLACSAALVNPPVED